MLLSMNWTTMNSSATHISLVGSVASVTSSAGAAPMNAPMMGMRPSSPASSPSVSAKLMSSAQSPRNTKPPTMAALMTCART